MWTHFAPYDAYQNREQYFNSKKNQKEKVTTHGNLIHKLGNHQHKTQNWSSTNSIGWKTNLLKKRIKYGITSSMHSKTEKHHLNAKTKPSNSSTRNDPQLTVMEEKTNLLEKRIKYGITSSMHSKTEKHHLNAKTKPSNSSTNSSTFNTKVKKSSPTKRQMKLNLVY
jgi:hypothetical protein